MRSSCPCCCCPASRRARMEAEAPSPAPLVLPLLPLLARPFSMSRRLSVDDNAEEEAEEADQQPKDGEMVPKLLCVCVCERCLCVYI